MSKPGQSKFSKKEQNYCDLLARGLLIEDHDSKAGNGVARCLGLKIYNALYTVDFAFFEKHNANLDEIIYWTIAGTAQRRELPVSGIVNKAEIELWLTKLEAEKGIIPWERP